jgi:hypothetical protein
MGLPSQITVAPKMVVKYQKCETLTLQFRILVPDNIFRPGLKPKLDKALGKGGALALQ